MEHLFLGGYVILIFAISWWHARKNSKEDFLIAGRNRPMWQILLSKVASSIGVGFFLLYTGYGYQYGWPMASLLVFQILAAFVFVYWAVPKIYRYAHKHNFLTMGDFAGNQLQSHRAGAYLDFVTAAVGFIWVVAGFVGGIKIVANLLSFTYEQALVITVLMIGSYILLSGYRVVLATDVVQIIVILGLLTLVFFTLVTSVDITLVSITPPESLPIVLMAGIAIFGFFTIFGTADRYQLIYSAKSLKAAQKGLLWSVIPFSIAFLPLVFIGLFMRTQDRAFDPDIVFLTFINTFTSPTVAALAGVMLVAGLMSTADTWVYAVASHFETARNKWKRGIDTLEIAKLRRAIIITLILMGCAAYFFRDLIELAIFSAAILVALSVPMLYIISSGTRAFRFVISLTASIMSVLIGALLLGAIPELVLFPIVFGALALLIPIAKLKIASR